MPIVSSFWRMDVSPNLARTPNCSPGTASMPTSRASRAAAKNSPMNSRAKSPPRRPHDGRNRIGGLATTPEERLRRRRLRQESRRRTGLPPAALDASLSRAGLWLTGSGFARRRRFDHGADRDEPRPDRRHRAFASWTRTCRSRTGDVQSLDRRDVLGHAADRGLHPIHVLGPARGGSRAWLRHLVRPRNAQYPARSALRFVRTSRAF